MSLDDYTRYQAQATGAERKPGPAPLSDEQQLAAIRAAIIRNRAGTAECSCGYCTYLRTRK